MPLNDFSVGRDIALDMVGPTGPLRFSLITEFQSKQDVTLKKIKGLDGRTRNIRFPDGWSGSFTIERQNSLVDDYFSQLEANFYQGFNELPITITETVQEANGAVTSYRFVNVLLSLDDSGAWKGDDSVTQHISFVAEQRPKIA